MENEHSGAGKLPEREKLRPKHSSTIRNAVKVIWRKYKPTDTLYLLLLCIISAVSQLLQQAKSPTVDSLVPGWMFIIWSVVLFTGALTCTVGHLRYRRNRNDTKGLLIEISGRWMLAPTTLAYSIIVWTVGNSPFNAVLLLGFSAACFGRIGDINERLEKWEAMANGIGRSH